MTPDAPRLIPHAPVTPYHRMELERVVALASSRTAVLPSVTGFEVASMKGDAHHREFLTQIRATGATGSRDVEFRYDLPLRQSGRGGFDDLAWDLVGRAHEFLTDDRLPRLGMEARDAIEPMIAASRRGSRLPRLVAVGVAFSFGEREHRICADIEMLGNDLAPGVERVFGLDVVHLAREVAWSVANHDNRTRARIRAEGALASGWIDQTALRLVDAAGLDRRDAVSTIVMEGRMDLALTDRDGERLDANLHLTDGVISGSVTPRSRRWRLGRGDLVIWGAGLPEILRVSLTGRRVGEIFQHSSLPTDAVIALVEEVTSVEPDDDDEDETDGWLRLRLEIPLSEIVAATGEPRRP